MSTSTTSLHPSAAPIPTPTANTTRLTIADERPQPATDISSTPTQSSSLPQSTSQTLGTNLNVKA